MAESVRQTGFVEPWPRRRRRGRVVLLVVLALAVAGAAAFVAVRHLGAAKVEPAVEHKTATPSAADTGVVAMPILAQQNIGLATAGAETRPIVRTVRATGMVGADETKVVRMRPLSRGRLTQTQVELGSRVRVGDTLASYDNIEIGDLTGQLAIAQANLGQARAEAEASRKALDRTRELLAVGGVARADVERRTADQARATAGLRTSEAEIAKLNEKLRRFGVAPSTPRGAGAAPSPILAPIDGVVIRVDVTPGEIVDVDREIYTIADLSTVWVQADVLERDLALIKTGLDVGVSVAAYADRRFTGKVSYVAEMLDPKTNTARVRCAVPNPDGVLKLNMFAAIDIAVPTGRDAVTVPPTALQYVDEQPVVFVRKDAEHFERRDVKLGVEQRGWIEIRDGVAADEAVVTTGSFELKSILLRDRISGD